MDLLPSVSQGIILLAAVVTIVGVVIAWLRYRQPKSQIVFGDTWRVHIDTQKSVVTAGGRVVIVTQASGVIFKSVECKIKCGKKEIRLDPLPFRRHQIIANTWVMEFEKRDTDMPEIDGTIDVRIKLQDGSKGRMKEQFTRDCGPASQSRIDSSEE